FPSGVEPEEQPAGFSLSLWSCRNRAICPLSSVVCRTSPSEPAVSNSSRCSFVGIVFYCMITAAEAAKDMLLDLSDGVFIEAFSSWLVFRARADHFVEIVRQPGLVLREITETLFRPL